MRAVIVDLDRPAPAVRTRPAARALIAALSVGLVVVIAAAWPLDDRPARLALAPGIDAGWMTPTERLSLTNVFDDVRPAARLQLVTPRGDVVLASLPDRLLNEPLAPSLRRPVVVRGVPGIAAVDRPAVVLWTEDGTTYWLASPTLSIDELIAVAEGLR